MLVSYKLYLVFIWDNFLDTLLNKMYLIQLKMAPTFKIKSNKNIWFMPKLLKTILWPKYPFNNMGTQYDYDRRYNATTTNLKLFVELNSLI